MPGKKNGKMGKKRKNATLHQILCRSVLRCVMLSAWVRLQKKKCFVFGAKNKMLVYLVQ